MTTLQNEKLSVATPPRKRYVPAVGPKLKKLLAIVFGLFALLCVNSVYLVTITGMEWATGEVFQNYFYQWMFIVHLGLGLLLITPVVVFGLVHMANTRNRPNKRAMRVGYALFGVALAVLATGLLLTRLEVGGLTVSLKDAATRDVVYWAHVITPLAAVWLFILHRLAGRRIKWKVGLTWAAAAGVFAGGMALLHSLDPRTWNQVGPKSGEAYFFPSLARTATGNFIPADTLMMNQYCMECHPDVYDGHIHSVHNFSSFNNPPYAFSVRETRRMAHERDGNVQAARWCAGCHDPVPFLSGAFEDPRFDDPAYDVAKDPLGSASISCTVCHGIAHVNSNLGNADYTIGEIEHYPFTFSRNPILHWANSQLIKAKPAFHKKSMLKPLHTSAEFCSTCHKVHLPPELNNYKWLRGQNHYDSYLLSGVSGHGITSWYYPAKAEHNCNGCHMPLMASNDFGSKVHDDSGVLKVKGHQFPSANTAIPLLTDMKSPQAAIDAHKTFLEGVMRVDIFGVKKGGRIDGELEAPIRPSVPRLERGERYLVEAVVRTMKMGHEFTQGTADSNEVWLDVTVSDAGRVIGRSGGLGPDGEVDPWSKFFNVYMLDRDGNRIDRRNPQDIFVPLYNYQIPPGAGDVTHLGMTVPKDAVGPIVVDVKLQYRKFDTKYMKYVYGESYENELPVLTLARDSVTFPVGSGTSVESQQSPIDPWQRWNDYGIGLFRKAEQSGAMGKGELRQADLAFAEVTKLNRAEGPLNRARVYVREGRLEEAVQMLNQASTHAAAAYPWSIAYFSALVDKQNGNLDSAIENLRKIIDSKFPEAIKREFDFSQDYRLLNELGQTLFERSKQERGDAQATSRDAMLREAAAWCERALQIDREFNPAHYNLFLIYTALGDEANAEKHKTLHDKYRPDDNARDKAIAAARRRDPAANHAAEPVAIYDLQRPGAYELPPPSPTVASTERDSGAVND